MLRPCGAGAELTVACCVVAAALLVGAVPSERAVRESSDRLARAWARGARRLPWRSVASHVDGMAALRARLRVADTWDCVPGAMPPARDEGGARLHSLTDGRALAERLFCEGDAASRAALVWECTPCVVMLKLPDGVWAAKMGTPFSKLSTPAKAAALLAACVRDAPCAVAAVELAPVCF
jgi:hypothetical protein